MPKRVGDLELDQDLTYQQREWKTERISWVIWALLLLATVAGLIGPGPASHTSAGNESGALWAEYDRFVRYRAPTEVLLYIDPALAREGTINLQLDRRFLDQVMIEDIVPKPEQEQAMRDQVVYSFAVTQTESPVQVTFRIQPDSFGTHSTAVTVEGASAVNVRQFVYP